MVLSFMEKYHYVAANLSKIASGSVDTFSCHNGSSTIDYALIPSAYIGNVSLCHTEKDHALNTSDHYPVSTIINIGELYGYSECPQERKSLRWDKVDPHSMNAVYERPLSNILSEFPILDLDDITSEIDIDMAFEFMVRGIHLAAEKIPRSKYVPHLKPYWSDELTFLKRDKMRWFNLWKQQGRSMDENDPVRARMKSSKKLFRKTIKNMSHEYEDKCIAEATRYAEVDRDRFWRIFKRTKGSVATKVHAVKNANDQVVYDIEAILSVWRSHFSRLSSPRESPDYDNLHFEHVSARVKDWYQGEGISEFLEEPFTYDEVRKCINKLHLRKAPGHDGITAEHLRYGGPPLCRFICILFNSMIRAEYIPSNFRKGIQVPLYKGKNTCPLDPDNYRGITLLSSFNKLFEMIIWQRIEPWWENNRIISELQGACRKGSSCIHTALTLQETIASQLEGGGRVFVAFFDVSKAFDSVWVDGLFFQLHNLGIRDSLWRMLYKGYKIFSCCVRIGDKISEPYPMLCGIHQGGFLSLVKYIAFVNSLIIELKESNLCCSIGRIQTTPLGYADDLATCTISGNRMHRVLDIVGHHGRTWRYSFNAKKSAIMVFGEKKAETVKGAENRMFKLGNDRVKEAKYYDHVGIKICLKGDSYVRTEEKVKKARTCLNMATCMGIRKGGLNILTCCMIFWTVVIPTLCFGCELWVLEQKDIQILQSFQRYAARRIQRLHSRSRNLTSRVCLGWLDIVLYITAKKALFVRTIFEMKEYIPIRAVLIDRMLDVNLNVETQNVFKSPLMDLIKACHTLNLMPQLRSMARGAHFSKIAWKKSVWSNAWALENTDWQLLVGNESGIELLSKVIEMPTYSIWWQMSDGNHGILRRCEVMIKILCKATLLKDDDCRLRGQPFGSRMCIRCELGALENASHMIMQCPANAHHRQSMHNEIVVLHPDIDPQEYLSVVLGKCIVGWEYENMVPIWEISARYVNLMYFDTLRSRQGIG